MSRPAEVRRADPATVGTTPPPRIAPDKWVGIIVAAAFAVLMIGRVKFSEFVPH